MFSVEGKLVFTARQSSLSQTSFKEKLDGQSKQPKSSSQLVDLPSAQSIMKLNTLNRWSGEGVNYYLIIWLIQPEFVSSTWYVKI